MKDFSIIVAMDSQRGIGKGGLLPWHLSADLKHFKKVTTEAAPGKRNAVVMGRKTWESIPERFRPLPGRLNIVLTRSAQYDLPGEVMRGSGLEEVLLKISQMLDINHVFVIGGALVYGEAIQLPQCYRLYVTVIDQVFDCDAFFPEIPQIFQQVSSSGPFLERGTSACFSIFLRQEMSLKAA